ncbi:MAG: hypothetical protein OXJ62_00455 [Spirochaetaceae bacterium]|nr:hypothetical protein [Spirochaetaceae bacterium]
MKIATYGVLLLAMLVAALLAADALREPAPEPATYVAPAPLPSVPAVAALKLAAQARADKAIAEGADTWPR